MAEKTPGQKLVTRAALLCKESAFQRFACVELGGAHEENEHVAKGYLINYCRITSRAELATDRPAQLKFLALHAKYIKWLNPVDEIYKDNLDRY